jgi:hypothetical protein
LQRFGRYICSTWPFSVWVVGLFRGADMLKWALG